MRAIWRFLLILLPIVLALFFIRFAFNGFQGSFVADYDEVVRWFNSFPNITTQIQEIMDEFNSKDEITVCRVPWFWETMQNIAEGRDTPNLICEPLPDGLQWYFYVVTAGRLLILFISIPIQVVTWLFSFFVPPLRDLEQSGTLSAMAFLLKNAPLEALFGV